MSALLPRINIISQDFILSNIHSRVYRTSPSLSLVVKFRGEPSLSEKKWERKSRPVCKLLATVARAFLHRRWRVCLSSSQGYRLEPAGPWFVAERGGGCLNSKRSTSALPIRTINLSVLMKICENYPDTPGSAMILVHAYE